MDLERLQKVFLPYHLDRRTAFQSTSNPRFVHYTTAETASCIIQNKEFWMRSTSVMNDVSEVEHGFDCLNQAYKSDAGSLLRLALDEMFTGLSQETLDLFNAWLPGIRQDTFITCFSEHDPKEDAHGRLSMWRAYGGQVGVAVVMNSAAMFTVPTEPIGIYSSPVAYENQSDFGLQLVRVAEGMRSDMEYVKSLGREQVKQLIFQMFRYATVSTKHPGFSEEREWRAIACPSLEKSPIADSSIEVIGGVPQTILKIRLENIPEIGVVGLSVPDLIDRLIIGPCKYPEAIQRAMWKLLEEAGVPDFQSKVFISGIPLRT
jgi:hypothetical protein